MAAAKMTKAAPLNGMHTAGIYSDMTVDGPEIGTLVIIVDRAKNLPNRKSIGKQDPYCAARLGKEAKKTETDRRGGQTPKWDQELRFTVHDSPDYYQLKVSVFNDDKKTDLIGETWVNLQDVVVPGGGQNDLWHNLNYRGKYAGEIRIEMTYYDSRPKQEKPSEKMRQGTASSTADAGREAMTGPRQPKPAMKRRPLPSDPTGATPSPAVTPDHIQTPPRAYPTPPAYIHTQSPLQAIEYNTPQNFSQSQQDHGSSRVENEYRTPSGMITVTPVARSLPDDRYEIYDPVGDCDSNFAPRQGHFEDDVETQRSNLQYRYSPRQAAVELPVSSDYEPPPSPGGPPPPPPAHRSNHASPAYSTPPQNGRHDAPHPNSNSVRGVPYEGPPQDDYRSPVSGYGQNHSYQAYSPPRHQGVESSYSSHDTYQEIASRSHDHDEGHTESYRFMQPTVEDDPSSPAGAYPPHGNGNSRAPYHDDRRYDQIPPTAPLNLSGRGSAASGSYGTSVASSQQLYNGPPSSVSPVSYRESTHIDSEVSSQTSYSQASHQSQNDQYQRRQSDDHMGSSPSNYVPSLPPTLVAGMDPIIAQEVSDRIYKESRASYSQASGSLRNRYSQQPQFRHSYPYHQQEAPAPFVPAAASSSAPFVPAAATYDERQSRITTGTYTPVVKPRAISPDPRVPARKSISPSPIQSPEERRLPGIPFGPDAYDALNPSLNVGGPAAQSQLMAKFDSPVLPGQHDDSDPGAKIIMHDGREVDPSDHLPEASWAPEPESRGVKLLDNGRGRPALGAPQVPGAGPRPLRQTGRPISMAAPTPSPMYQTGGYSKQSPPAPTPGRNRLQKKSNRNYEGSASQSSPLAHASLYPDDGFATRSLPRAQTVDFAGENRHGSHSNSRGGHHGGNGYGHGNGRNSISGPPPIPAKVPLNHRLHQLPPTENAWALLEEMKSIDLGSGRARRRGHAVA